MASEAKSNRPCRRRHVDGEDLLIMKESDIMGVIDAPVAKQKAA